jgi:GTP cyclohydrolase II
MIQNAANVQLFKEAMFKGMDSFAQRIERKKALYELAIEYASANRNGSSFVRIAESTLFNDILEHFGVALRNEAAQFDLSSIYEVGVHLGSGALLIANKGATLFSLSPRTQRPYISRHIGCCVYFPGLGIEVANVGLVGDVYEGNVILRSESACTPSFLFGSQRCNCAHQWETIRELAAEINPIDPPAIECGRQFEQWVQTQFTHTNGKHIAKNPGRGMILMHIDTQNGMGSGFTEQEFSFDLFSRASLRHRGEYSAEQIHQTTMAGGFRAIGIKPDPRGEGAQAGYRITPVVLDWLKVSRDITFLSNNKTKIAELESAGYKIKRVKSLGAVNAAGAQEAEERGTEFHHMDIGPTKVTFEDEMERLKKETSI